MADRASDRIAVQLRRMVITGQLERGAILGETDLANMLKCGRTPLREALQQLDHEGLIKIAPRRGILIPHLSIIDFQKAHEALLLMGSLWTELAARRINHQQLQELKDIIAQQERQQNENKDLFQLTELVGRFHIIIAEATGNPYFVQMARHLYSSVACFTYPTLEASGGGVESLAEHRAILEALESKDADLAKKTVEAHVTRAREDALRVLARGDQGEPPRL